MLFLGFIVFLSMSPFPVLSTLQELRTSRHGSVIVILLFSFSLALSLMHFKSLDKHPSYNLPHVLNIPSFAIHRLSKSGDHLTKEIATIVAEHPSSVLALYEAIPSICARRPYLPNLQKSIHEYGLMHSGRLRNVIHTLQDNFTVVIVVDESTNDVHLDSRTKGFVLQSSSGFAHFVVLSTSISHLECATQELRKATELQGKIISQVIAKSHDESLLLSTVASNIIAVGGAMGALASLAANGTVRLSPGMMGYAINNEFRWLLSRDTIPALTSSGSRERTPTLLRAFSAMGDVQPTCCEFRSFGGGKGDKMICTNSQGFAGASCLVLSIGFSGRWSFERAIAEASTCDVHVFDCMRDVVVPEDLSLRVAWDKFCLGVRGDTRPEYRTLSELIQVASGKLGTTKVVPNVVKIDVEGKEFALLDDLVRNAQEEELPEQLIVQIYAAVTHDVGHPFEANVYENMDFGVSEDAMRSFFRNMSSRGYDLVHRADNPAYTYSSEVTLLRRTRLPAV